MPNIRHFIAFRTLFNARFYYPVFTLLFLDYGLTLEQFAILNAIWALTIVMAEVPSGALADVIGRKRLVVVAAVLMVVEMAVLTFVPLGSNALVFAAFLVNRILSGLAEASASGADEALAFDSLKEAGLADQWPLVLERLMRVQSIGMFVAMVVGAAVYDPALVGAVLQTLAPGAAVAQSDLVRLPVVLTLFTASLALFHAARLAPLQADVVRQPLTATILSQTFQQTFATARWIAVTPMVCVVILAGLVLDSVVRLFITLASQYFRLIDLPEASYGFIFSAFSLIGIVMASWGKHLVSTQMPRTNFGIVAALGFVGLAGSAAAWPYWGVLPAFVAMASMPLLGFLLSHYLNRETPDDRRATVLSFKGLALNLAYGVSSLAYSAAIAAARTRIPLEGDSLQDAAFAQVLWLLPFSFAILLVVLALAARLLLGRNIP